MPGENGGAPVAAARPVIRLGGEDRPDLTEGIRTLRIEEADDGLAAFEVTIDNEGPTGVGVGFLWFGRDVLDFGKAIAVTLGGETLFDGVVTGLEGRFPDAQRAAVTVLAEDRLQDMRMTRRSRTFFDTADADVIRRIASDHRLQADVDLPGPTHRVIAQLNQSDLAFLRERAALLDGEIRISGTTLVARRRSGAARADVTLHRGSEMRELVVLADLAHQRTRLEVAGWDVAAKEALRETAGESVVAGDLGGGQSGAAVLQRALGERVEVIAAGVPVTRDEARARAEAAFRERARRFVRGHAVCRADARLRVGVRVALRGVGPLFEGDYRVFEVCHTFDERAGLVTRVGVERPAIGGAS